MAASSIGMVLRVGGGMALVLYGLLQARCSLAQTPSMPPDFQTRQIMLSCKKQSFVTIIADLSNQIGKNIMVDDEPQKTAGDIEFKGSVKDGLDRISETFDYNWSLSKRGVILMNKRFKTNPAEYPQMNVPELRQMAKDILAAFSTLPYDMTPVDVQEHVARILKSMTPEQADALRAGKVFHGRDLAPEQRRLLAEYRSNRTFAPVVSVWSRLAGELDELPRSYLQFREYPTFDLKRAGLQPAPPDTPKQLSFSYVYHVHGKEQLHVIWATSNVAAWKKSQEEKH